MAGRIATPEELLALMMELQNEMPGPPEATYSPEELREFAEQDADKYREHMEDNLWMLALPAMARHVSKVGGAISDGIMRVRNTANPAKDLIWSRRLRNLDPHGESVAMLGYTGLTDVVRGAGSEGIQEYYGHLTDYSRENNLLRLVMEFLNKGR
jgi:hypothetical protein